MKIFTALYFCSLLYGFASDDVNSNEPRIDIVDKTGSQNFGFYFIDQFGDIKNHFLFKNHEVGANHYTIHTSNPLLIILTKGNFSAHPVFIEPGDTCEIYFDGESYQIKGQKSSEDLSIFSALERELGYVFPDFSGIKLSKRLDLTYLLEQHKKRYFDRKEFLDNYEREHIVSSRYAEVAKQAIYYKYLRGILYPFYVSGDTEKLESTDISETYYLQVLRILEPASFDDSLLFLEDYRLFVWNYCRFLSREYLGTSEEFSSLFECAKANFSGKTRDFLMFYILKNTAGQVFIVLKHVFNTS
ncbi:MAG: hypothetical protein JNK44_01705 [Cyclobacteriaceae bacterium]|mgnify:CR=1 FL=1|nr:hypothetical protein [Cyclobacteriaceae bacterium]